MAVGWFSRQQSSRAHPPRWLSLYGTSLSPFSLSWLLSSSLSSQCVFLIDPCWMLFFCHKRDSRIDMGQALHGQRSVCSAVLQPHTHKFIRQLFLSWRHPPAILPRSLYISKWALFLCCLFFLVISFFFLPWNIISHQWLYLSLPPTAAAAPSKCFTFLFFFFSIRRLITSA